jgi:UDP-galactopyranose mutase
MAVKEFDWLIVGTGLFGATFAQQAMEQGKKVLMIDKRPHIGGNVFTEAVEGIQIHRYGAHIFHTSNKTVWEYVNRFASFNHYVNRPKVHYKNNLYSFPINLMTLYQIWGVKTPEEARKKLEAVRIPNVSPQNLEEWVLSQVGEEIYEIFIKGYTQKQWGRHPSTLPAFIIKRLPIRLTFDDNYFDDCYQGIPIGGYTSMVKRMLEGATVETGVDFLANREFWANKADTILFTGPIDAYFNSCYGPLEYRSLRFDTRVVDVPDYQGNAVINYTEAEIPHTRVIEHKHFEFGQPSEKTVVTWEYPHTWNKGDEPYYPVNDEKNQQLYKQYKTLAESETNVLFGGRLAEYRYYDMHHVIASALALAGKIIGLG